VRDLEVEVMPLGWREAGTPRVGDMAMAKPNTSLAKIAQNTSPGGDLGMIGLEMTADSAAGYKSTPLRHNRLRHTRPFHASAPGNWDIAL